MDIVVHNEFTSNGNKSLLWNLMYTHEVFKGVEDKYLSNVKADFELKIATMRLVESDTIINANKRIIMEMVEEVKKYKGAATLQPMVLQPMLEQPTVVEQVKLNVYEKKKQEFESLINVPVPAKPEFTDKNDDSPIAPEVIDDMLTKTIAWREQELKMVTQTYDEKKVATATQWINNDTNKLKIGENIILPIPPTDLTLASPKKKVNFDFLSKLKTKEIEPSTPAYIQTILANQEEILKLLQQLLKK
jgi:hypothetical protein